MKRSWTLNSSVIEGYTIMNKRGKFHASVRVLVRTVYTHNRHNNQRANYVQTLKGIVAHTYFTIMETLHFVHVLCLHVSVNSHYFSKQHWSQKLLPHCVY